MLRGLLRSIFFFHGLSNYDSHFITQKLYNFSSTEIKIIPKNTEKYLSFSVGCVHFKDSYQFLSESLAILVQNLMDKGPDHFVYINKFIKDDEQRELLKQKGISLQLHERCSCFEKKAFAKERRVFQ